MPKKASGMHKGYYEAQKYVTQRHKTEQARKRSLDLQKWLMKGVKKNGKKVLTVEEREVRRKARKVAREEARRQTRMDRIQAEAMWMSNRPDSFRRPFKRRLKTEAGE